MLGSSSLICSVLINYKTEKPPLALTSEGSPETVREIATQRRWQRIIVEIYDLTNMIAHDLNEIHKVYFRSYRLLGIILWKRRQD
jgi:hypothetical protein